MLTRQECELRRNCRHAVRLKRLDDRNDLSLEISEDEAEYIEHLYRQEIGEIGASQGVLYELFQVTTGVGL